MNRPEPVIAQYGAFSTDGEILFLSGGVFLNIHDGMIVLGPPEQWLPSVSAYTTMTVILSVMQSMRAL